MRIITLFLAVLVAAVDVSNLKLVPKQAVDHTNIVTSSSLEALDAKLFRNTDNIFVLQGSNSIVMHTNKLNTAARVAGHAFSADENDEWVEFEDGDPQTTLGTRVPVTACLDSQHGDGGLLAGSFSKKYGKTSTLDLPYGFDLGSRLTPTLDYKMDIATTLTITASYQCTVPANSTGRIFVQPYFTHIANGRYRKLRAKEGRSLRYPIRKQMRFEPDEWITAETILLVSLDTKPIITCVTDPDYLDCNGEGL